jgi:hypothetical protein
MKTKTIHGHYSDTLQKEAERIKILCKEKLDIDITWTEATAIAAMRSQSTFMSDVELKKTIAKLRGL